MKIYHFHNGTGGGVLSVIRNLLRYRQHAAIENHVIYTINKEQIKHYTKPGLEGAASEQVFYYSPTWNFYYTCWQLAKLLPNDKAVIIAHDWLELGMVSNLGLRNPVIQFLHGDFDYYYDLAKLHAANIDEHICVSNVIADKLKVRLPDKQSNIRFLRFPVPDVDAIEHDYSTIHCAFFVRDLTDPRKQFSVLPSIERTLVKNNVLIHWHIAGGGMSDSTFKDFWGDAYSERIRFYGELNQQGLDSLLRTCNTMILPSLSEGFPVALVESMKYGIVPLVSKWEGAADELVVNNETGFQFAYKDFKSYADFISELYDMPEKLKSISLSAKKKADELFNAVINTKNIELEYFNVAITKQRKVKFKAYGSSLDVEWLPNSLVRMLRILS